LRYRGAAQAEFSRALRLLKGLQAEAAREAALPRRAPAQLEAAPEQLLRGALPIRPEARTNPGHSRAEAVFAVASPVTDPAGPSAQTVPVPGAAREHASGRRNNASPEPPIEPEIRKNPG
jgi:hypothetical protein